MPTHTLIGCAASVASNGHPHPCACTCACHGDETPCYDTLDELRRELAIERTPS